MRGPVDVGEHEPEILNQIEFIDWLHAHGAVNVTRYVPPHFSPEQAEAYLNEED